MKKITRIMVAVISAVCLFSAVGCGAKTQKNENELSIFVRNNITEIRTANLMTNAFKEKKQSEGKEITIEIKTVSDDYNRDMLNAIQSGELPDIIYIADENLENWAMKGTLENLDPYFANANFDFTKYDEAAFEISKCTGKNGEKHLYMVPRTYDQPIIAINVEMWGELMDTVPVPTADESWTWSKLMQIFGQLRTAMDNKYGSASSTYYPFDVNVGWQPFYNPFIRSFGGYVYNPDNASVGMSSQGTRNAITKLKSMIDRKFITPLSSGSSFTSKKAAMWFISRPSVTDEWVERGTDNVAFLPIPIYDSEFTGLTNGTSYYAYGSVGFAMNSGSQNKSLAYDFLEFTLSEEGQEIWAKSGLSVPTLISMQSDANAEWKKHPEFVQNIDQSAFTFLDYKKDFYTRIPATYARTGDTNKTYETSFYNEVKAVFATLKSKSVDAFISDAQTQLMTFIG